MKNGVMINADMRVAEVRQFCELDETRQQLIKTTMAQLQLSARAYHRILKLVRTFADLAGGDISSLNIWRMSCSCAQMV